MSIPPSWPIPHASWLAGLAAITAAAFVGITAPAEEQGLLPAIHHHRTLTTTITDEGDLNPYAVIVAPCSVGMIKEGEVLVDNFNNISNLQGTGGSIIIYDPGTRKTSLFAEVPQHLPGCPGGVGMTAAMTLLKSGWVIVGSAPSTDGSTRTRGEGGLIVVSAADGKVATVWADAKISDPWGNVAAIDNGTSAILFVSMVGFGVQGPSIKDPATGLPAVLRTATVLRITLDVPAGQVPKITDETVIADGFGHRADKDAFLVGPTGLALAANGTLYVSDAVDNRIAAIPDAATRTTSAGTGTTIVSGGLMKRPLALALTPLGHLLVINAKNGMVVEVDPQAGKQLYAQWIDTNQAQSPPGNGDLFGLAMRLDGKGFYYVEDDTNFLMEASR